jgi:hypothetical protein
MNKLVYVSILSVALGTGFGWAMRGTTEPSMPDPGAALTKMQLSQLQARPSASTGIDLAQLHEAIREELSVAAAQLSRPGSKQAEVAAVTAAAPQSAEVLAQRHEAVQSIQGMISNGQWGAAERASFQEKLASLDPQQAEQALDQVLIALNSGTVQAQTTQPL